MIRNVASFSFTPKTSSQFIFVQMPTGIAEEGAPVGSTTVGLRNQQKNKFVFSFYLLQNQHPSLQFALLSRLLVSPFSEERRTSCEPRDNLLTFFFQQMWGNSSLLLVGLLFMCRERNEVSFTLEIRKFVSLSSTYAYRKAVLESQTKFTEGPGLVETSLYASVKFRRNSGREVHSISVVLWDHI